ncbi:hypothetical protein CTA2_10382 [Colletotrichum tanaceti]|uniref:Extracellular membrane protein CFEM domain-containing protein n=1 Tax=Colletotrichum tanaceti TaxID=1306861 RepID=A0A4U6X0V3_9PEZI|nr:hypothetical protein CTA2_10382 [Colletotrichum tanaceti]TKW48513.1 hypothetical protein CTA1_13099 [Colletotrichum tanaceti]
MRPSLLYAALFLAVGATAQTCSDRITYCRGDKCDCFYKGVDDDLNADCRKKGYAGSLGSSRTAGAEITCDHQCCTG